MSGSAGLPNLRPMPTACDRLRQADQAYSDLMTGASVRAVNDENGERIEFSTPNRQALLDYMRVLQAACPDYQAVALTIQGTRPTRFLF